MDTFISSLANFFIRHPTTQMIVGYICLTFGCLFTFLLVAVCLHMAFGKQKSFYYQQGSLVDRCWKAGWLLSTLAIIDLGYRELSRNHHISMTELVFDCVPLMILLFAQIYGSEYRKAAIRAKRGAEQEST